MKWFLLKAAKNDEFESTCESSLCAEEQRMRRVSNLAASFPSSGLDKSRESIESANSLERSQDDRKSAEVSVTQGVSVGSSVWLPTSSETVSFKFVVEIAVSEFAWSPEVSVTHCASSETTGFIDWVIWGGICRVHLSVPTTNSRVKRLSQLSRLGRKGYALGIRLEWERRWWGGCSAAMMVPERSCRTEDGKNRLDFWTLAELSGQIGVVKA